MQHKQTPYFVQLYAAQADAIFCTIICSTSRHHILYNYMQHKQTPHFVQLYAAQADTIFCTIICSTGRHHILYNYMQHKQTPYFIQLYAAQADTIFCTIICSTSRHHILLHIQSNQQCSLLYNNQYLLVIYFTLKNVSLNSPILSGGGGDPPPPLPCMLYKISAKPRILTQNPTRYVNRILF